MPVILAIRVRRPRPSRAEIRRLAEGLLSLLRLPHAELSLSIVGTRTMRALNFQHRGKDKPTDVLSFPQDFAVDGGAEAAGFAAPTAQGGTAPVLLGDVVICQEAVIQQAAERGVPPRDEFIRLLIHGVLHLLGEDHETPAQARRMFARARTLEKKLHQALPEHAPSMAP